MTEQQLLFLCFSVLTASVLAAWGVSSAWRVERALAVGLERTLDALRRLNFDRVESPARHEEIRGMVIEAEGVFPALEQAWVEFEETLVQVEGQPRAPQPAQTYFGSDRLSSGQTARLTRVLAGRTVDVLPVVLATLGLFGSMAVLGLGLISASQGGVDTPEATRSMSGAIAAAFGYGAIPFTACMGIRLLLRLAVESWRGQLEEEAEELTRWIDSHYRTVTSVELLARLLALSGDAKTGPLAVGGASSGSPS